MQCQPWSNLELRSQLILPRAKEIFASCTSCPAPLYVPSDGSFTVSYSSNKDNHIMLAQVSNINSSGLECTECPPGAECPGTDLTSKTNFWGYLTETGVEFQQCPAEYCCEEAPCSGYNKCSRNRAGTLCGACQEGYSLSMLSNNCIQNTKCHDHWPWVLTILAMVIYMLWYTFKNDVFAIPGLIAKKVCRKSSADDDVNYIDKGYFGIMIYFLQATTIMRLSISQEIRTINAVFSQLEAYIALGLNIEISFFSEEVCSIPDLTTTDKNMYKFLFLFGIYCTWCFFFVGFDLTKCIFGKERVDRFHQFKIKLVLGLVEIVKYTYLGFTSIVFYSLTCVSITESESLFGESFERSVWFYDGSVECFGTWQKAMILFGVLYGLPYPLMLYLGMKLIEKGKISRKSFFVGVFFPLFSLIFWSILACKDWKVGHGRDADPTSTCVNADDMEQAIYEGFKGGYRDSKGGTQYWECVMMLRRLLLSATALIPNSVIQLSVCLTLCIVFLIHHTLVKPFRHHVSNKAETLSLCLLCGTAGINLIKSILLFLGENPQGDLVGIMMNLTLLESMFILFLLAFILFFESVLTCIKLAQKKIGTGDWHLALQSTAWIMARTGGQRSEGGGQDVEEKELSDTKKDQLKSADLHDDAQDLDAQGFKTTGIYEHEPEAGHHSETGKEQDLREQQDSIVVEVQIDPGESRDQKRKMETCFTQDPEINI